MLLALFLAAFLCPAEGAAPPDYKKRIESILADKHPGYREFFCEYYGPARAIVGRGKNMVDVVCCDWGGRLKSGAIPLMISRQFFVFGDEKLSEAKEGDIRWLDANPVPEKKRSKQLGGAQDP